MFGIRRKTSLALVPFAEARPRTFNTLLCDGVTARHLPSFAELVALHARLQRERPDCRVLASLDQLGQACYTSGHCTDLYELDPDEDDDAAGGGEDADGLGGRPEFPVRLARLLRLSEAVDPSALAGLLPWGTDGDANDLVTVNRDPERALRIYGEKEVLFQFVPVEAAADTIAAFPNGYFHSDLTPMQNHCLARYLEADFGLALFGIGSRFLGFRRDRSLDEAESQALAIALIALHVDAPEEAADALARLLAGRDVLLFRYTES
jgi:hypothetical protein